MRWAAAGAAGGANDAVEIPWPINSTDVEDDVAVLAVRMHPLGAGRPAVAGPEVVPGALPRP